MKLILVSTAFLVLLFCSCGNHKTEANTSSQTEVQDSVKKAQDERMPVADADSASVSKRKITAEVALEGVGNYCHQQYGWNAEEEKDKSQTSDGEEPVDKSSMMYLSMGEETDTTFEVVFRSYTGAFVHFYVDKASGKTKIVERVPSMDVEDEMGAIDIFEYLK